MDSGQPTKVLLRPFGVGDFADDMDAIVAAARAVAPEADVVVQEPTRVEAGRRGVIARAILEVVIELAPSYAFSKIADAIIAAARAGWKARQQPNTWPRGHYVKILGPDGEVMREVKVSDDPPADSGSIAPNE